MDIEAYLARIGYAGSREPNSGVLRDLQQAHLRAVPFENLDIHLGVPIVLDLEGLFAKIVTARRGGFCYELNGLFAALLSELGFRVTRLSARVVGEAVPLGPEFDHMTLQVECPADGDGVQWLCDVGFGDSFLSPLRLADRRDQVDDVRAYRLEDEAEHLWLWERDFESNWNRQYRFTLIPRQLADFAPMCQFQQSSPSSSFTHKRVATVATATGRVTVRDNRLIVTERGVKREEPIGTDAEFRSILFERVGLDLKGRPWQPLLVLHAN